MIVTSFTELLDNLRFTYRKLRIAKYLYSTESDFTKKERFLFHLQKHSNNYNALSILFYHMEDKPYDNIPIDMFDLDCQDIPRV